MCRKRSHTGGTNCICSISAISGISQGNLDIALQQTMLEYCCSNRKSVETLVKIRNNVYGHTKAAQISDSDYTRFKNDIETAVLDIAAVCRKETEFKTALNDVNHRNLGSHFTCSISKQDIAELFALAQSSQNSMDQTMTKMQTLQETTQNLMDSSKKADEHTAAKLQKLEEKSETTNSGYRI
ncbi:unnamed protein product [Mytilus edulis]|uniref:Uncharacterized protein n=1 Tax=Mytilus edulis TaxID=6550 RepID=A0A8S3S9C2_MYTED|nr:unnamed protein product [Mytilus edulis]